MRNRKPAAIAASLFVLATFALGSCAPVPDAPELLAFTFRAADNPVLSADVAGAIDTETGFVTVRLPATVSDYSNLVATVEVTEGNVILPALPKDFSRNPTALTVGNDLGEQITYLVDVAEETPYAPADAVLFTEYYSGTGYDLSGDKNRWLEITNRSATANVDLSQYRLLKISRDDGVRTPERDQDVRLAGTLAPGASLVLYADRLNTKRFGIPASISSPDLAFSDISFNGIVDFDGDDGFQLVRDGIVLDALGPNGGTGAEYNWGRQKRLLRKNGKLPSAEWDPLGWIAYGLANSVADAVNSGALTPVLPSDRKVLTFFAFEALDEPSYGIVDEAAHTVSIALPPGIDRSSIIVSIGVEGLGAWSQGQTIVSGETALDFSSPVTLLVYPSVGAVYQAYTVNIVEARAPDFTTAPIPFDGGIGALLTKITYPKTSFATTTVEGVVTARNVYYKLASDSNKCFFIQDSTGGILVWTDVGIDAPIGARVRVEAVEGFKNYSMPLISVHGAITRVDAQTYDIHYDTGDYANNASLAKVYRWSGAIASGMADHEEGTFAGTLMFQGVTALGEFLETGDTGSFYGPVLLSYSKYKMCLSDPEQIRP